MDIVYQCGNMQFGCKIDESISEGDLTEFLAKVRNAATAIKIKDEIDQHKLDIFVNEQNLFAEEKNLAELQARHKAKQFEFQSQGGKGEYTMPGPDEAKKGECQRSIQRCQDTIYDREKRIAFLRKAISG